MNAKETLYFPKMVALILVQLVYYTLTEVETFLMVVVAALFGWHFGWDWGVTLFFTIYFMTRMIGGYVSLLANKLHMLALVKSREDAND